MDVPPFAGMSALVRHDVHTDIVTKRKEEANAQPQLGH